MLVTGGAGYLGRAIVRAIDRRGHTPVIYGRHASSAGLPCATIDGDVRDRAALVAAVRGCDALCHSAALVSIWRRDPREFDAINVGGLENALAAVREAGLARIVYTSSFIVRSRTEGSPSAPIDHYQRTKVAADVVARRAREAGAPIVVLYPGVVYGPGIMSQSNLLGRMMADHLAGRLPGIVGADRIWSFSWIDDVAAAHAVALDRPPAGASYDLGGENAPQIRPFEMIRELRGHPLPRRIPYWLADITGSIEQWRARLFDVVPRLTRATVVILKQDWPLESRFAERDLDYRVTPLATGIRRLLSEWDEGTGLRKLS